MAELLELMKQRMEERFLESLRVNPERCQHTRETIAHAYKQSYGVMIAYNDARESAGFDVHHLPRWEAVLRMAASGLASGGNENFQSDWEQALDGGNAERLRCYPLLKGLETMAKLLGITPEEPLERALKGFEQYRKTNASSAELCATDDSVSASSNSRRPSRRVRTKASPAHTAK